MSKATRMLRWQHHTDAPLLEAAVVECSLPSNRAGFRFYLQAGPTQQVYEAPDLPQLFGQVVCLVNTLQGGWCELLEGERTVMKHPQPREQDGLFDRKTVFACTRAPRKRKAARG